MNPTEKRASVLSDPYGDTTRPLHISAAAKSSLTFEEMAAVLFQPDILVPAQYFATTQPKIRLEPEHKLMLAILEDGVACFQRHLLARDPKGKELFREAEEWILEESSPWIFSFEHICEVLGFSPVYVRRGLMEWKSRQLSRRPKAQLYRLRSQHRPKPPAGIQPQPGNTGLPGPLDSGPDHTLLSLTGRQRISGEGSEPAMRSSR